MTSLHSLLSTLVQLPGLQLLGNNNEGESGDSSNSGDTRRSRRARIDYLVRRSLMARARESNSNHPVTTGTETIDISCGVCGVRIYKNVKPETYGTADGSQPHIEKEIYLNDMPSNVVLSKGQRGRYVCKNRCHEARDLYLIDEGTGAVDRHGYRFAVACGSDLAAFCGSKHELAYVAEKDRMVAMESGCGLSFADQVGQCAAVGNRMYWR